MKIEDIIFDEEDKNLFLIDDLQLKADAIRYSILPKLEIINNELVSRIIECYEIDFYTHFSLAKSPHFRLSKTQRKEPTKRDYNYSGVSITGQRKDKKWYGLVKSNGILPKISPTSLSIDLTTEGIEANFFFNHPKNFTKETYKKFYNFFISKIDFITGLANQCNLNYEFSYVDVFSIKQDLKLKLKNEDYDLRFGMIPFGYPISYKKINAILLASLLFFPVLNSCIEIALGNEEVIEKDIAKLTSKIIDHIEKYYPDTIEDNRINISEETRGEIVTKAESKIKIQAGIRWQVFKRDVWKCVSCGRRAEDNIILHIDHIIPRSKGGKDEMNNYQTLCETCNIGKSNKDNTDLRKYK